MPLYMDIHKASDYDVKPTVEDIKRNHIADLEVQHKYGVKFLQYWINEEAGEVYCLMEAPDKEACSAVHREAHGDMPCNVIELKGGDYMAFLGKDNRVNEFDIVERSDGSLDSGYRIIMVVDILSVTDVSILEERIDNLIKAYGGTVVAKPGNRKTIVFLPGTFQAEGAVSITELPHKIQDKTTEIRIGLTAGEPVTTSKELFADAIQQANDLCDIACNRQILISSRAKEITGSIGLLHKKGSVKVLSQSDEQFLNLLLETIRPLLSETIPDIDTLSKRLGLSRSGLYRNITNLTGLSANEFIKELRMKKALRLIRSRYGNITQVAMESGFNNPSYFAKNFQERFGLLPLKVAKLNS